jgi:hypothetical protein
LDLGQDVVCRIWWFNFVFEGKFRMKKIVILGAFIAIVSSLTSLTASGASVIFSGSISPTTLGSSATTDLPQFNPALGTLTGVQVTLDFSVTPFANILNITGGSQNFTPADWGSSGYTPSLNTWTVSLGSDSWNVIPPTVTTGPIYGTGQSVPSFNTLELVGGTSAPADLTAASGLDFAAYTGAGNLVFGTAGTGNYAGSGLGFAFGGGGNLTGTASVTYTYVVPVPEPATLAFLSLGGLALILRKRQPSQA